MMKLFKLEAHESAGWDCNQGFVIRASNEKEARDMAQSKICDEKGASKIFWLDDKYSSCSEISLEGDSEIILQDFLAG